MLKVINRILFFFKARYFDTNCCKEMIPCKFDLSTDFPHVSNFENFVFNWTNIPSLVFNKFLIIWTCIYKTKFLKKNNFYFPKKLSFDDVPLHVESVLTAKRISYVNEVLYNYRIYNNESVTSTTYATDRVFDFFIINNYLKKILKSRKLESTLRKEFIQMRIDHFSYHLNSIDKNNKELVERFFQLMKKEFINMNLTNDDVNFLPVYFKASYLSCINSCLFSEYQLKLKDYLKKYSN